MPLLSHAEAILSYNLHDREDLITKASILHNLAAYLQTKGDYPLSMLKISEAVEIRRRYLDEEDPKSLWSIHMCANLLLD